MRVINTKEPFILFVGDLALLCFSLWFTLFLRYQSVPSMEVWDRHFYPFLIIFALWVAIFYLSGLYERHTSILKNKVPLILSNAYIITSLVAFAFFYVIPIFSITPKTILIIFIAVSFLLLYIFRVFVYSKIVSFKKYKAVLIGDGHEIDSLYKEVNNDKHYSFEFVKYIKLNSLLENISAQIEEIKNTEDISIVVIDLKNKNIEPVLPQLYSLLLENIKFIDLYQVYEEVFYKVPVSLIQYDWFIENVSTNDKFTYDIFKRFVDIGVSLVGGLASLILYPFIIIAMKIENPGSPIFIPQIRVGKNNKPIKIYKFRSMLRNENGVWLGESENKITKVGKFLRKSSIDEFPQFWNIFKGDISLVGPRPDMTGLEERLSQEIPYYSVRYVVKPGLSGWAQTRQDVIPNTIEQNKDRLGYDLYYIKNRSVLLDTKIILKTLKTLVTRGAR